MARNWFLIILVSFCVSQLSADQLSDAKSVAGAGYKAFLQGPLSDKAYCEDHHLSAADKFSAATLGEPFQLYCITPESINGFVSGDSIDTIATKTNIYMFPVLFNGVVKLFLDVSSYGTNHLEIGSLGQSALASHIEKIQKQYAANRGYTPILYQNYQTQIYLFSIPQAKGNNLTIINPDTRDYSTLTTVDEAFKVLKTKLQELTGF